MLRDTSHVTDIQTDGQADGQTDR